MTMKNIYAALAVLMVVEAQGQSYSETLNRELGFELKSAANTLWVANINGSVKVEAYSGDKVVLEVQKKMFAKTAARLEKAKSELDLGVIDRADTIILYVKGLCGTFGRQSDRRYKKRGWQSEWGYDWDDCDDQYDYRFDFLIKVPAGVNLYVSTVNEGDIKVTGVAGEVVAHNVNGSISLSELAGPTDAYTVNGDVTLDYSRNPVKDCRYYTLNGDINANFQKGLGATFSFQSFNGSLYSNLEPIQSLPSDLERTEGKKGIQFKVSSSRYKVGSGGARLDFETFNGDVYLKEKMN